MKLRPPTATINDPFFAAVRRRHPEVDVVLLPPPEATVETRPVSDDWAAAIAAGVVRGGDR